MKITKNQLRRLIREEAQKFEKRNKKLVKEQFGAMDKESLSPLASFAQAWSGLGNAVQEQTITVINGYIENNEEAVYDVNPNALDLAHQRLRPHLRGIMGEDADDVLGALEWAKGIFKQGEDEVEADARAAGDK